MPEKDHRLEDIRLILRDLLKVIKVVSLYPENNPLPQSLKQSFSEKLEYLAEQNDGIEIIVEKTKLLYKGEVVFEDTSREETLARIFFENGITKFTFKSDIDVAAINHFLTAIRLYLNRAENSNDLVTLLWQASISGYTFESMPPPPSPLDSCPSTPDPGWVDIVSRSIRTTFHGS